MKTFIQFCLLSLLLHAFTAHAGLTVTAVAQGSMANQTLFIKSDGSLWATGDNEYGQLGDGTTNNAYVPEQIVASNVTAVAVGEYSSLYVKSDGSLWAMGWDTVGELGNGSDSYYVITPSPVEIESNNVVSVAAGTDFSFFIKTDGGLWAMGDDYLGQLGDHTQAHTDAVRPEQVATNVIAVAAGDQHALFVTSDGTLWGMGDNSFGELGIVMTNYYTSTPEMITNNVAAVAAGYHHSVFLKTDGSVWTMGFNNVGQIGDNDGGDALQPVEIDTNVTAIAAGDVSTIYVKSDGSLWFAGDGDAIQANGVYLDPDVPEELVTNHVTAIAGGYGHTLYLQSNGSLWGFGGNSIGQLGDGFTGVVGFPLNQGPPEVQIFPLPRPVLCNPFTSQQTNLQINATCGFGANYCLLSSTNIALPLSRWTPLLTNSVVLFGLGNYSVTLTNAVNLYGHQFYMLQSQ